MWSEVPPGSLAPAGGDPSAAGEREFGKILVVGCGFMGSGIAQVCAQAGLEVLVHDADPEALDRAMEAIERSAAQLGEKGQIGEPVQTVLSRIRRVVGELAACPGVDLAIEAVFESLPVKQGIWGIFETGDMVGLDVTHAALLAMYDQTRDPRWYPPTILRRKVAAGHLGRKAGKGWYEYDT
jgi:3-hydroxyacyl-CoA dehydrogenase